MRRGPSIGQETNEILHGDFVAPIIDFDASHSRRGSPCLSSMIAALVVVQIELARFVIEDTAGKGVARIARHVIGEHEDDLAVGYPQTLYGAVEREGIGEMAVVEPEAGGADQDRPIRGVRRAHIGKSSEERQKGCR